MIRLKKTIEKKEILEPISVRMSDLTLITSNTGRRVNTQENYTINHISRKMGVSNAIRELENELKSTTKALEVLKQQDEVSHAILVKRHIEEKTVKEIADELGLSTSNTRDKLQKVEKKFLKLHNHYEGSRGTF